MENMTTDQADQDAPADEDFRYTDKRFMVSWGELVAAAKTVNAVLKKHGVRPAEPDPSTPAVRPVDLTDEGIGGTGSEARKELVLAVLRAINHERLGYAEGTIARHKDGRVAKRYYDKAFCCLRWLVVQNEDGPVNAERLDDLGRDWQIVYEEPWNVGGKIDNPPI